MQVAVKAAPARRHAAALRERRQASCTGMRSDGIENVLLLIHLQSVMPFLRLNKQLQTISFSIELFFHTSVIGSSASTNGTRHVPISETPTARARTCTPQ